MSVASIAHAATLLHEEHRVHEQPAHRVFHIQDEIRYTVTLSADTREAECTCGRAVCEHIAAVLLEVDAL